MPLPSRVSPFGHLFATTARGTLMGNRGGRLHDARRKLGRRRWSSKQWICCQLDFKDRHRDVWGEGYSELFFLDEVMAFAAGHRPCFECRRRDAESFAMLFSNKKQRATATAMDTVLHAERLAGQAKRLHRRSIDELPDGSTITIKDDAFAVHDKRLLRWTASGYADAQPCPRRIDVEVLTPPSILTVLSRGYRPMWHPSAE